MFSEKYNFNDNIEIYSDNSYNADSDEENSDQKIQMKKVECINLFLEKKVTSPAFISKCSRIFFKEMQEMLVFQALQVCS